MRGSSWQPTSNSIRLGSEFKSIDSSNRSLWELFEGVLTVCSDKAFASDIVCLECMFSRSYPAKDSVGSAIRIFLIRLGV